MLAKFLAAITGLSWALTVMGLRSIRNGIATVVVGNIIASLATLPFALPLASLPTTDLLIVSYLGIVQVGLAYIFLTRAIPHVPAFEVTTIILLEPVLNPVWVWLVHGERPTSWALVGGAIILIATYVNAKTKKTPLLS